MTPETPQVQSADHEPALQTTDSAPRPPDTDDHSPITAHPSQAPLLANRENAQKSTGPRLPCGKAVVSHNAVKHGIFARHRFIERGDGAEDPADFTEVLAEMRRIYLPDGPRQDDLVERIADCRWRLHRLRRFEIGAVHRRIDTDPEAEPAPDRRLDERIADSEERLDTYRVGHALLRTSPGPGPADLDDLVVMAGYQAAISGSSPTLPGVFKLIGVSSKTSARDAEWKREQLTGIYESLVKREEANLADLLTQRKRADQDAESRGERERLLYAVPDAPEAYLVIRYETMLMRERDRAVRELDRQKTWGE